MKVRVVSGIWVLDSKGCGGFICCGKMEDVMYERILVSIGNVVFCVLDMFL